ncbi:hypothetical protein [Lysobacter enzymogenes]|uniref:hypothetical protein n=1 Tax=Lysobacter enzymogenes TaxID=69 RepID=UPI00099DEE7F|nr:hypothetical protein [Lysobacter enzymogenes]UZW61266.1 hypothetical protein BV903_002925 [Lysobacter enzymogenes]
MDEKMSVDLIAQQLQSKGFVAEIYSVEPPVIHGGTETRQSRGIKVYARGFSVRRGDAVWLVSLPVGQTVEVSSVANAEDVAACVVAHFDQHGLWD